MDRQIIYDGQVPQTLDLLNTNKNTMLAIAKMAADVFGTSTIASGLACVPTAPATMSVNVNPGQIYQNVVVDQTAYSDIALDTSHSIVKSGILMDAQNFAITAPGTAGFSQNYLIQATFLETDTANTVLPYYNSANPSQALNGPGGGGGTQPTRRAGQVSLQLLAGTAATTGTQTTPAVTTGYIGLWVITVANGASSITSGNITPYPGQPILPSSVLASIQNGNLSYAVATGTANAHTIALTPALTSRIDGMVIRYKAPAANTGALTLNDGVGTVSVLGAAHSALQGGETVANGDVWVQWNSSISGGVYIMIDSTGGALQVAPATQSQHAMQLGQATGRLLRTSVYSRVSGVQNISVNGGTNTTTGATTFTNHPSATAWRVRIWGAGSGAPGCPSTGSGIIAAAPGGSGGAYGEGFYTSGMTGGLTVTVGAKGAGGAAGLTSSTAGGSSSVGAIVSCPGGPAISPTAAATATSIFAGGATPSAAPSGANIVSSPGQGGGVGLVVNNVGSGGQGGASGSGTTGPTGSSGAAGLSATSPGAGGAGAAQPTNGGALAGGSAQDGLIIIEEFA